MEIYNYDIRLIIYFKIINIKYINVVIMLYNITYYYITMHNNPSLQYVPDNIYPV